MNEQSKTAPTRAKAKPEPSIKTGVYRALVDVVLSADDGPLYVTAGETHTFTNDGPPSRNAELLKRGCSQHWEHVSGHDLGFSK